MILLYSLVLLLLGAMLAVTRWRVAALERKHAQVDQAAMKLVRETTGQRPDPCKFARRQFLLGQLVQKRDRIETRYDRWLNRSERLGKLVARMRAWKGRTLPYTLGALDVYGAMYLIDRLGFAHYVGADNLMQMVVTWVSR